MSLQTKEMLKEWEKINPQDPELCRRRTGRSTTLALSAIAECYKNRGKWILIRDHYHKGDRHLMGMIVNMVNLLNFDGFEFDKNSIRMRLPL